MCNGKNLSSLNAGNKTLVLPKHLTWGMRMKNIVKVVYRLIRTKGAEL